MSCADNDVSNSMVRVGGLLVYQGKPEQPINWETIVDDAREERIQDCIKAAFPMRLGDERKANSE